LQEVNDLFHYSTEQAMAETIPVADELTFIGRYVQLQKKRIAGDSRVVVDTDITGDGPAQIAPMLLLPFVENAFKYGVSYELPSSINISTAVQDGTLHLKVENTDHSGRKTGTSTGTGIANVMRRLELQYKGKYQLEQHKQGGIYSLSLKLNLS
jgi:sensor histidine kinase YesM